MCSALGSATWPDGDPGEDRTGLRATMVGLMCQYQPECPTTRHRPGTKCPVRVRIENHNRKVDEQNRQAVWALVVLLVIAGGAFAAWWFLLK